MISDAAKAAFRRRAGLHASFNDFSPGFVARMRSFASAIGGSDPFAEPSPTPPVAPISAAAKLPLAHTPPTPPTAADIAFEKARASAKARAEVERRARFDADRASAMILDAVPLPSRL